MAETLLIEQTFANDGFWPDQAARDLIEGWRLHTDARDAMIVQAILAAMLDINDRLSKAKAKAISLGFETLEDYADGVFPFDTINDEPVLIQLYRQAVGNLAKAKIQRRIQAQQRKPVGESEMSAQEGGESFFLDECQNAIAGILTRIVEGVQSRDYGVHVGLVGDSDDQL